MFPVLEIQKNSVLLKLPFTRDELHDGVRGERAVGFQYVRDNIPRSARAISGFREPIYTAPHQYKAPVFYKPVMHCRGVHRFRVKLTRVNKLCYFTKVYRSLRL